MCREGRVDFVQDDAVFLRGFKWQPGTVQLAASRTFILFRSEAILLGHSYPIPEAELTVKRIRKFSRAFSILTELAPKADGRAIKKRPNDDDIEIVRRELWKAVRANGTAMATVDDLHQRLNANLFYAAAHVGIAKFYKPRAVTCSKLVWLANPYIGVICDSLVLSSVGLRDRHTPSIARYYQYCNRIEAIRSRPDTQVVLTEAMSLFATLANGFAYDAAIVAGRMYDQAIIVQDELAANPMAATMPR
jgi:hypothetical protein